MSSLAELLKGTPGNVRASEGAGTTTLTRDDNRHQIFNLSAQRDGRVPSTGIKSGEVFILENRGFFDLVVQTPDGTPLTLANGCNLDATIRAGSVYLVALQDAPTTPAHWRVIYVHEKYYHTTTWTANGGGGTGSSGTIILLRNNQTVLCRIHASNTAATTTTGTDRISSNTAIPTRFRSTSEGSEFPKAVSNAGDSFTRLGMIVNNSTGTFDIFKDFNRGNFAAGTSGLNANAANTVYIEWHTTN